MNKSTILGVILALILYSSIAFTQETKGKILFASMRGGDVNRDGKIDLKDSELYVVDVDGNNLKRITHNSFHEKLVAPSPNGKEIVFLGPPSDTVYIINTEATEQKELLTTKPSMTSKDHYINVHILCKSIPWSRDGTGVFIPFSYPLPSWYLVQKDGEPIKISYAEWSKKLRRYDVKVEARAMKKIEGIDSPFILVSPREDRIISIIGPKKEIYLINLINGEKRKMGIDPFLYETAGSWSPDGKKVCLYRFNRAKNEDELCLLKLEEKSPKLGVLHQGVMRDQISWSSKSDRIVFVSSRDKKLYLLDIRDRKTAGLTQGLSEEAYPIWLRNGQEIFFLSKKEGDNFQMYRINIFGKGLKKVIDDPSGILWAKPWD